MMQMNSRNFPAHGEMSVSIDGRILVIEGEGPGNTEVAIQYQKNVQPFREQLSSHPWASLVKLRGVPLLPPEATTLMTCSIKRATKMNLIATAVILIDVEFAETVRQFWQAVYEETGLAYEFFDYEWQARDWLEAKLAEA